MIFTVLSLVVIVAVLYYISKLSSSNGHLEERLLEANRLLVEQQDAIDDLGIKLGQALEANSKVLSQKKSSEVRTGQIAENFAPLLAQFPYKPKDCHFLGMPTDFLVFDLDNDRIVFLEIKSGNARESKKQNKIRKIISDNRVYYERMQINELGAIHSSDSDSEV